MSVYRFPFELVRIRCFEARFVSATFTACPSWNLKMLLSALAQSGGAAHGAAAAAQPIAERAPLTRRPRGRLDLQLTATALRLGVGMAETAADACATCNCAHADKPAKQVRSASPRLASCRSRSPFPCRCVEHVGNGITTSLTERRHHPPHIPAINHASYL